MARPSVTLQAVGVVRSPVVEVDDRSDWHDIVSEIHVDESLSAGLRGIDEHVDIVVVFFLHKFKFDPTVDLQPKRGSGIFARHSNRRPNAIGSTTVELLGVEGSILRVKGLDAIDGSPVLDIKPYEPRISKAMIDEAPGDLPASYP